MNEQKQEQLKKVFQEHPELNEKLKEIGEKHQTEMQAKMTELLKEYGVELIEDDFKVPTKELSEDELAAIAGGGGCGCWGAGGGGGDSLACACVAPGVGMTGADLKYGGCACLGHGAGATNWGDVEPPEDCESHW